MAITDGARLHLCDMRACGRACRLREELEPAFWRERAMRGAPGLSADPAGDASFTINQPA